MQVGASLRVYLPLGLTVASPNAELNGPCSYSQPPSRTQRRLRTGGSAGGDPAAVICCFFLIVIIFFFSAFHRLTPSLLRFLPARRTSVPVLLFVPFRQPVGINGNVNTARYRGNFTKMGIYFWAGAAGVRRVCVWGGAGCRELGGMGEKLGVVGGRPGGRSEMVRSRSGSGYVCALAPAGLRLCNLGWWWGQGSTPCAPEGDPLLVPPQPPAPGAPRSRRGFAC